MAQANFSTGGSMVDCYDLYIDGFPDEETYGDPLQILHEIESGGYDPLIVKIVVWIDLTGDPVGISLSVEQFKRCLHDGKLPPVKVWRSKPPIT